MKNRANQGKLPLRKYWPELLIVCYAAASLGWIALAKEPPVVTALFVLSFAFAVAAMYGARGAKLRALNERRQLERRTRESERLFQSLFEHNPNAIGVFDRGGRLMRMNETTLQLTGYKDAELRERTLESLVQGDIPDEVTEGGQPLGSHPRNFDLALQHKDGYRVDVNATTVPIHRDEEWSGFFAIFQDITKRKRTEQQIRHMAYYDDLTGLPNRRLFKEQLADALGMARTSGEGVAVLYVDIDRFKLVNDGFGYEYGDMLLMQVAERFTHCVSESDFLAHTEGDEFTFFYSGVDGIHTLPGRAEAIFASLEQPFAIGEYQLHITASIGISYSSEQEPEPADSLMKYADIALSKAKEKGRNNFQIFSSAMKSVSIRRLKMESELRRAIQNDEFMLYFQPQIDVDTGRIVGNEALIRWRHPERGFVSPGEFIPIAEESGFIVPIGEWVLLTACKQNKAWQDAGFPPMPVSVNLSVRQFLQHNLRDKIAAILEATGLEPKYLELEITESMTTDVDFATGCMLELKQLGVHISIDDFGTGYSSLHYLKKFPIDKLKIDQSFVRDIMVDPGDAAIVSTIIAMTHHLNLKVIAEGVETEEQLKFLHRNHCHQVQGYWFSPPVPNDRIEDMLQTMQKAAP